MVTSEQVFEFVKDAFNTTKSGGFGTADKPPKLSKDELAEALGVVARLVEAEIHAILVHEQIEVAKNVGIVGGFGAPSGTPFPAAN